MCGGATAAVELTSTDHQLAAPGPTFAGRDVFAPAAAHLCAGVPLADLGRPIDPLSLLPGLLPLTREEDGALVAEVLWVDRYGNCQLNVDPDEVAALRPAGAAPLGRRRAHRRAGRPPTRASRPARSASSSTATGCCPSASASARPPRSSASHVGTEVALSRPVRRRARRARPSPSRPKATPVRPGTTIVLGILLALILGAAALQLFFML